MHSIRHYTELISQARLHEEDGEIEKAATLYERAIRQEPFLEFPYNRLMIIYRKLKQPEDEARVIRKALQVFQDYYDRKPEKMKSTNPRAAKLSKALLKMVEGKKKINAGTNYPEPIPSWIRRMKVVEKKL
jgi:tetratricopeptide (TPR) repeat protein